MPDIPVERIKQIKSFPSLVKFLQDELHWQLDANDIEDLTYDYDAEELGLSEDVATKIKEIKQLRPFSYDQPWGIFYIDFEPKRLPVVVLRLILQKLKIKKKTAAGLPNMRHWELNDLLFISSYGPEDERATTFAHFNKESEDSPPVLRVINWDTKDAPLHLERCLTELQSLKYDPDLNVDQWREKWVKGFILRHRQSITTSKALAKKLADIAKDIRENCQEILQAEKENGPFHKTLKKFKEALIHDLTEDDFADMFAQTISYGLLYTAIRSHVKGEGEAVSAEHVQQLVLPTNPFLKEVMEDFFNIGRRKWDSEQEKLTGIEFDELGVNEIISTLKDEKTDFDAILRDFMNRNPNEDPVIHFYELFLKEYDALKRKSRGVYYTPRPVVSFIVRSVHEILKKDFGLEYGLADTSTWGQMIEKNPNIKIPDGVKKDDFFVQILDPALGTGTFLVETIDIIHKTMKEVWEKHGLNKEEIQKHWNKYVPEKLLPRLYGFELMMAPYAIAHMKIGIKLFETGYENFEKDKKRVQVYLTNTLEKAIDTSGYLDTLDPAMAEETREANEIKKNNSVTIVIGNPPYSVSSANKGIYIDSLLDRYRKAVRDELNIQPLSDDYIKFILYAHDNRVEHTGCGIIGMITNHSYLSGLIHRGMREQLQQTFDEIYVLDLHGNTTAGEVSPDGKPDNNVFDIKQGVAISIFIKKHSNGNIGSVKYFDLWGLREDKYSFLKNQSCNKINYYTLQYNIKPNFFFIPKNLKLQDELDEIWSIVEIFGSSVSKKDRGKRWGSGVKTNRDHLLVSFDKEVLQERMALLANSELGDIEINFQLNLTDGKYWNTHRERQKIRDTNWQNNIIQYFYRPFDLRYVLYQPNLIEIGRGGTSKFVMRHMFSNNQALLTSRQQIQLGFHHVICTRYVADMCAVSLNTRECTYLFPLYLYPTEDELNFSQQRTSNLDPKFVKQFAESIGLEFVSDGKGDLQNTFGPEDIFHYIYAVLHSPTYRSRYAEFLKIDFPRVPITSNVEMSRILCNHGGELAALHLMKSDKLNDHITTFPVSGDNAVSKVGEKGKALADIENGKGKLFINKTQYFDNLPEEVWNFHIGGYQVCYKWLYDRKKAARKLSAEDIDHYHKIVVALSETIKIMKQIDEVINAHGGWPIQRTPPTGDDTKNPAHR